MRRGVIVVSLLVALGWGGGLGRMVRAEDTSTVLMGQASLEEIYKKLDEIAKYQHENKEIGRQLDQILKNQAKILEELSVVKIRATRR